MRSGAWSSGAPAKEIPRAGLDGSPSSQHKDKEVAEGKSGQGAITVVDRALIATSTCCPAYAERSTATCSQAPLTPVKAFQLPVVPVG